MVDSEEIQRQKHEEKNSTKSTSTALLIPRNYSADICAGKPSVPMDFVVKLDCVQVGTLICVY